MFNLALYQPDIPQNVGAAMRLCACLDIPLDIIEPTGFPWDTGKIRRAGMDYMEQTTLIRHRSWNQFTAHYPDRRLVLLTTKTQMSYLHFQFQEGDILLAGQESAGVPESVHTFCVNHVTIPMKSGTRSLNVVNACAMVCGEASRQLKKI